MAPNDWRQEREARPGGRRQPFDSESRFLGKRCSGTLGALVAAPLRLAAAPRARVTSAIFSWRVVVLDASRNISFLIYGLVSEAFWSDGEDDCEERLQKLERTGAFSCKSRKVSLG